MVSPDWWKVAEPKVHAAVSDFVKWVEQKISKESPRKLIVKNPFLFRARAPKDADELADRLLDAFLSSSEETHFGDILEDISIAICREAKGGRKSSTSGIDLEYEEGSVRTVAQVKSGVKWGNSSQRKKLVSDFTTATRILRQGDNIHVRCVEGICYGPSGIKDRGTHLKIVGNAFWEDISGWSDTGRAVLRIIEYHAGNGLLDVRKSARADVVSYLQRTGASSQNGIVDWDRLYDLIMMPTRERPR